MRSFKKMDNREDLIEKEETTQLSEADLESVAGGVFAKSTSKIVGPKSPIITISIPTIP
jgi:hypothetical protein